MLVAVFNHWISTLSNVVIMDIPKKLDFWENYDKDEDYNENAINYIYDIFNWSVDYIFDLNKVDLVDEDLKVLKSMDLKKEIISSKKK